MAQGRFVVYLRVSTQKQGRSGLGLEAQQRAVTDFLNGGAWSVVAEFSEIESGKSDTNRPQLQRAASTGPSSSSQSSTASALTLASC